MKSGLVLVLGGARSGKSRHAEALVTALPAPWVYLATGRAFDAEMQAQLESYLVTLGILQPGQTLSAHEVPPDVETTNQQPVYED